jgi:hypothetical protein
VEKSTATPDSEAKAAKKLVRDMPGYDMSAVGTVAQLAMGDSAGRMAMLAENSAAAQVGRAVKAAGPIQTSRAGRTAKVVASMLGDDRRFGRAFTLSSGTGAQLADVASSSAVATLASLDLPDPVRTDLRSLDHAPPRPTTQPEPDSVTLTPEEFYQLGLDEGLIRQCDRCGFADLPRDPHQFRNVGGERLCPRCRGADRVFR